MELGRAKTQAVKQAAGNGMLAVLHAWRDLGKYHIAIGEGCIPFFYFTKRAGPSSGDCTRRFIHSFHWNERDHIGISQVNMWTARIDSSNFAKSNYF